MEWSIGKLQRTTSPHRQTRPARASDEDPPGRRIGILGGSFNPVHTGHLIMAQDAFEHFSLDRVLFLPAYQPPHKQDEDLASDEHRLAMLNYATEGDWRFEVCPLELERGGISYTVDSLRELRSQNPEDSYFFIIGLDSLLDLHSWKNVDELLALCQIVTIERPGIESSTLTARDLQLPPERAENLLEHMIPGHRLDIASSDIRARVSDGLCIRYLVPAEVEMYIAEHRLYGP